MNKPLFVSSRCGNFIHSDKRNTVERGECWVGPKVNILKLRYEVLCRCWKARLEDSPLLTAINNKVNVTCGLIDTKEELRLLHESGKNNLVDNFRPVMGDRIG